jgi:Putative peptidoglycan binding domain
MKTTRLFHWFAAAAVAASLPVATARAMSGHNGGGFARGGSHGSFGHGPGHQFAFRRDFGGHHFADHRFFHHGRDDHFFHHHNRFFFGFDFAAFGFPYWWYPDYYYGYPYDYASYDYSPVYDYRYWYGLSTAVQTELARRGYYRGPIDGVMGSGSREAIRAFQRAQGLPVSGLIDPPLLRALKLPAVPRVAASDLGSVLNFG